MHWSRSRQISRISDRPNKLAVCSCLLVLLQVLLQLKIVFAEWFFYSERLCSRSGSFTVRDCVGGVVLLHLKVVDVE